MHALRHGWVKQSELWRRLNVVRSVISEMVRALRILGWVTRVRAADSRTWLVRLTGRGRALYERAYDRCVESGDAALHVDCGLGDGYVESDTRRIREEFLLVCDAVQRVFRVRDPCRRADLYMWRPEDYYFWFVEPGEGEGDVPFVTDDASSSFIAMS